jgi:mannose-6-phosphate isomerase-like protein (cupin superfamily)
MLVYRWQAPIKPTNEQARMIFLAEDLVPHEETLVNNATYADHRHPFDEVRMVLEGEVALNISGNQLLLRPGDKIMIPSNTRHSYRVIGNADCLCLVANRAF